MSRCASPPLKLLTIAILAVLPVLSAYAGPQSSPLPRDGSQQNNRQDNRKSGDNSLSDAVRRVERTTRGEVLSAERVQYDGRDMHRVKVVDDQGKVRVFMQDPSRRDDNNAGSNRTESNRNNDGNNVRNLQRRQPPTRGNDG